MARSILVSGATGRQGGATVRALAALNTADTPAYRILALTRNAAADKAQALASLHGVEVVEGDLDNLTPVLAAHRPHAIFYVVDPTTADAEKQGNHVFAAAKQFAVGHVLFHTGDIAGRPDEAPVEHYRIVTRLEAVLRASGVPYTILRPSFFMENLLWPLFLHYAATCWTNDIRYKWVAVADVGRCAARVLADPGAWAGREVCLAGDATTRDELVSALGRAHVAVPTGERERMPQMIEELYEFCNKHEMLADPAECERLFGKMTTLDDWLAGAGLAQ